MVYSRGEIVWANLEPAKPGEQGKVRPCLIVSNDALNHSKHPCVIVCPLTTELQAYSTHVLLTEKDGLEKESMVLTEQVRAIAKSRIIERKPVSLPRTKMEEIEQALKDALDLE